MNKRTIRIAEGDAETVRRIRESIISYGFIVVHERAKKYEYNLFDLAKSCAGQFGVDPGLIEQLFASRTEPLLFDAMFLDLEMGTSKILMQYGDRPSIPTIDYHGLVSGEIVFSLCFIDIMSDDATIRHLSAMIKSLA